MRSLAAAKSCLTDIVTNFSPLDQYGPQFARAILGMALESEALLYSIMAAALMHRRAGRVRRGQSAMELHIVAKAVRLLSEQMTDQHTAVRESNIWAVVALGYTGAIGELRTGKLPQQSVLKELQTIHIYGRLINNKVHLRGLVQLLQMIGGPQNLKTPSMGAAISLYVTMGTTSESELT